MPIQKIVCEICGSNKFIKDGEFFVCECCDTKYRLGDIKIQLSGPIDISGSTVKYDRSEEMENYRLLANRHFSNGEYSLAQGYYRTLINNDPNDYDSVLKHELCTAYSNSIYDYDAQRLFNPLKNVFEILSDRNGDEAVKYRRYALDILIKYTESDISNSISKANISGENITLASKELKECICLLMFVSTSLTPMVTWMVLNWTLSHRRPSTTDSADI